MSAWLTARSWPASDAELRAFQEQLARLRPELWRPPSGQLVLGGCFVCFPRGPSGPGAPGDPAWGGASLVRAATIRGEPDWRSTSGRCSACRRSVSRIGRCSPRESGRPTSRAPRARWRSGTRSWLLRAARRAARIARARAER